MPMSALSRKLTRFDSGVACRADERQRVGTRRQRGRPTSHVRPTTVCAVDLTAAPTALKALAHGTLKLAKCEPTDTVGPS